MKYIHVIKNDVLIMKTSGDTSPDEFDQYFREMDRVEDQHGFCPDRVIDLRSMGTFSSDTKEYWPTIFKRNDRKLRNSIRCSILVKSKFQFGMAMVFNGLNNNPNITTEVFEDIEPLSIWLDIDSKWLERILDQLASELNASMKA